MIVLDASVLIAHLETTDAHHERATDLLLAHATRDFAVSSVTLAEVLAAPAKHGRLPETVGALDALDLRGFDVTMADAGQLAVLRAETGLRMPDCCVLNLAERESVDLSTFDVRLAQVASSRGVTVIR